MTFYDKNDVMGLVYVAVQRDLITKEIRSCKVYDERPSKEMRKFDKLPESPTTVDVYEAIFYKKENNSLQVVKAIESLHISPQPVIETNGQTSLTINKLPQSVNDHPYDIYGLALSKKTKEVDQLQNSVTKFGNILDNPNVSYCSGL